MIELIQVPFSPFCLVQRRILEFAGGEFKTVDIGYSDRSRVWKLTRQRYYNVPIVHDGRTVVFETTEDSQIVAKYLNEKYQLDLFPKAFRGIDRILWRFIEDQIEAPCFKLNDIHWEELIPKAERLDFLRHKERKYGRGCLESWRERQPALIAELTQKLLPFETMLAEHPFLLYNEPHFIDFDLWGMLACFLYTGHYELPAVHTYLNGWYGRMSKLKKTDVHSEKLHS